MITAERYHDISCGHRVVGHESKCQHLHGHNYRIHFVCRAKPGVSDLDKVGRVIDFTAIKERLCMWIENNWDHKFLAYENDTLLKRIACLTATWDCEVTSTVPGESHTLLEQSIVWTPFNPTAENMAWYLVNVIGPQQLSGTDVELISCKIEETMKCSASYHLDN